MVRSDSYSRLRDALVAAGLETVLVQDTCDETNFESILASLSPIL